MTKYYRFTDRKTGHVFVSRHEFPDFCAGLTKEQRDKEFIVEEVEKKDVKNYVW